MIVGLIQPLLYLAFFGPLLVPVIQSTPGFPPGDAWQVLVPALLVQLGLFDRLFVGFGLVGEYRAGVVERMRVTPVSRVALLLGRSLKDVVVLVVQAVLLTVLAVPFGLRAPIGRCCSRRSWWRCWPWRCRRRPTPWRCASRARTPLATMLNAIVLPVLLLSGILLPMTVAPAWLFALSRANPFVYIVDAERAIFQGELVTPTVLVGMAVSVVLVVVTVGWGVRTFQRESA